MRILLPILASLLASLISSEIVPNAPQPALKPSPWLTKNQLTIQEDRSYTFQRIMSCRGGESAHVDQDASSSAVLQLENHEQTPELQQIYYGITYSHSLAVGEVLESLQVSAYHGLTSLQSSRRLTHFGPNKLQEAKKASLLQQILEQFEDRLVQILVGVAFLSALLASFENNSEAFIEPVVILMILIINAFVGIYQSSSAAESLDALKRLQAETTTVLRDSQWLTDVPVSSLVPGDIISLKVGDRVPADARVIEMKSSSLYADEASLTGESTVVMKSIEAIENVDATISDKSNILFSGTIITAGSCIAVVVTTGERTEMGKIDAGVQAAKEHQQKTPLQEKLDEFGKQLAMAVSVICVLVWLINVPHFGNVIFGTLWKGALHYMKIAVALGVAAIPEGLPAVITLCLSLGTTRMAKQQVIVRKLPSVETLGCTTVICTDKTGTLTTGQMTVTTLLTFSGTDGAAVDMKERQVEGVSYIPIGQVEDVASLQKSKLVEDIVLISSLCNEAKIIFNAAEQRYDRIGEPTEAAFKVFAEKLGKYKNPLPAEHTAAEAASYVSDLVESKYQRLAQLEFHRDRKSMGMMIIGSDRHQLLVKGAAEMVVMRCNRFKLQDGSIVPLTKQMKQYLLDEIGRIAARPLRCLAMAYKDMQEYSSSNDSKMRRLSKLVDTSSASNNELLKDHQNFQAIEDDMILVALCGIKDPARPEVKPAISDCRKAGIRVMMITGDSKETAVSIAKDVGIFDGSEDLSQCAFTGQEFFQKPLERQYQLLRSNNKVFCRTEPQDKQRLVSILQDILDEVVAMTGDGVNDAPALSQASIGVAMGITGTDAAKSAADMILADDNFASIVRAVEEGRNIFYNMQTFCCFLISSNIGEVILMAMAAALGFPEPLLPMHLLWINLVTDGPPATALGFNPSDPRAMQKPPRSKHESLLSRWMLARYLLTGAYVGFAAMSCYYSWFHRLGLTWMQLRSWTSCDDWNSIFVPQSNKLHIDCSIFSRPHQLLKPQSMALASLVCMEMLKALSAVSLDQSLLVVPPWRNPWLLLSVALPTMLHVLVMYFAPLSRIFHIAPLDWSEWKIVLQYSFPILVVEEVLKFMGRYLHRHDRYRSSQSYSTTNNN